MFTGAIVGAAIVLLLVLCEGASGFLWQDSATRARFYCPSCDLRYARFEVHGLVHVCPFGHPTTVADRFRWIPALITACVTFMVCGAIVVGTGVLR